jgi:hypothetical protein
MFKDKSHDGVAGAYVYILKNCVRREMADVVDVVCCVEFLPVILNLFKSETPCCLSFLLGNCCTNALTCVSEVMTFTPQF